MAEFLLDRAANPTRRRSGRVRLPRRVPAPGALVRSERARWRSAGGALVDAAVRDPANPNHIDPRSERGGGGIAALTTNIGAGQRAGLGDPQLDAARTAHWLIWMIERGLYQLVGSADDREVESQLDALTDIIWRVVYQTGCQGTFVAEHERGDLRTGLSHPYRQ